MVVEVALVTSAVAVNPDIDPLGVAHAPSPRRKVLLEQVPDHSP